MADTVFPLTEFLSNDYFLMQTVPYLLPHEIFTLALTSKAFHNLLFSTRGVWRHLDLSCSTILPIDTPKSQPVLLRRNYPKILSQSFILRDTQTLILDGLPFNFDRLSSMLMDPRQRISILSIRQCPINQPKFMQLLHFLASRPQRPSLKGVYIFGQINGEPRPRNAWERHPELELAEGWADTLAECEGIISFDAALCQGPRHRAYELLNNTEDSGGGEAEEGGGGGGASVSGASSLSSSPNSVYSSYSNVGNSFSTEATSLSEFFCGTVLPPKIALTKLKTNCQMCHAPRPTRGMPTVLYPPPPLHSSSLKVAASPPPGVDPCHYRCEACLRDRFCQQCQKWWCESCYDAENGRILNEKTKVTLDCYECGRTCFDCKKISTRKCRYCKNVFCITHSDGASEDGVSRPFPENPQPNLPIKSFADRRMLQKLKSAIGAIAGVAIIAVADHFTSYAGKLLLSLVLPTASLYAPRFEQST